MRPRLVAAREVLRETGAIFVSIDDNEVAHLRLLLDEVFGERELPRADRGQPQPQGPPARRRLRDQPRVPARLRPRRRRCVLDASHAESVDPGDFPLFDDDGRRYRHLPLRNTNKKFNPVTAPTLHFPVWGDPATGRVATTPFAGAVEVDAGLRRRLAGGVALVAPRIDERPDDLVCRRCRASSASGSTSSRRTGSTATPGAPQEAAHVWLAEEVGSTDTAVAELKELVGHVFESPEADRPGAPDPRRRCRRTPRCSTSSPAAARPATRSRWPTPPTAAAVPASR